MPATGAAYRQTITHSIEESMSLSYQFLTTFFQYTLQAQLRFFHGLHRIGTTHYGIKAIQRKL